MCLLGEGLIVEWFSIPACHTGDPGSIPGQPVLSKSCDDSKVWKDLFFLYFYTTYVTVHLPIKLATLRKRFRTFLPNMRYCACVLRNW